MLCVIALALSAGACESTPTRPSNRRPSITSVAAFPTVLGLGDSTLVTVYATDPDGDTLVYDWEAYNGLRSDGDWDGLVFDTRSATRMFFLERRPASYDTAFIWCSVRDRKGGGDSQIILFTLRDP